MAKRRKHPGYSSYKHPILEYIFMQKTQQGRVGIGSDHPFTLQDIGRAFVALQIDPPVSYSNFVLDLTRQPRNIASRLPESVYRLGYDLRKRTGPAPNNENYAGVFVFVGVGNELHTWLTWPTTPDHMLVVENTVLEIVRSMLSNDEGALFSVIDYCDVFSQALHGQAHVVFRVQNPMKWQPNEIDGLYVAEVEQARILYPVEAKALSTRDSINLDQMNGAYQTILPRRPDMLIVPLGVQMTPTGMLVGVFDWQTSGLQLRRTIQVTIKPGISAWLMGP